MKLNEIELLFHSQPIMSLPGREDINPDWLNWANNVVGQSYPLIAKIKELAGLLEGGHGGGSYTEEKQWEEKRDRALEGLEL